MSKVRALGTVVDYRNVPNLKLCRRSRFIRET